jgi:hypothetical protein
MASSTSRTSVAALQAHAVSRITLRRLLLTGLEDVVWFDKQFVRYEQSGHDTVTAFFADGSSATGSVLVGADGARGLRFHKCICSALRPERSFGSVDRYHPCGARSSGNREPSIVPEQETSMWLQHQSAVIDQLLVRAAATAVMLTAVAAAPSIIRRPGFQASDTRKVTKPGQSAAERMLVPDAQGAALIQRAGTWNVVSTLRLTPDAPPIVRKDVMADRRMVGPYLEEVMKPVASSASPGFRRIAYLTYSRVEGRWQYVSIDTRFPVGIMPAYSFGKETPGKIELEFQPIAFVGLGPDVEGRMVRSNFVISWDSLDRETARQFWIAADGTGQQWLAVQYDYARVVRAK